MTYPISSPSGSSSYLSPSPKRSSPLSNPPVFASNSTPSPYSRPQPIPDDSPYHKRRVSQPISRSPLSTYTPIAGPSSPPPSHPASPPLSRSHPLLGSYQLSLLHSRMSHAHQPHTSSSAFALHITAIGKGRSCPPELRCPDPLVMPFGATYYDLQDPCSPFPFTLSGASQSPWTGTVDLENHFFESYSNRNDPRDSPPPTHPGYQVAPTGQLQILVKSPSSAVKVFLIPYDLRKMGVGGRMLVRERTYVETASSQPSSPDPGSSTPPSRPRESLRYAIQLQFGCFDSQTPHRRRSDADTSLSSGKAYYLTKSIKVIFVSCPLESHQDARTERIDEIIPSSTSPLLGDTPQPIAFSPGSMSRAGEWETVRKKWFARQYLREDLSAAQTRQITEQDDEITFERQPVSLPAPVTSPIRAKAALLQPTAKLALDFADGLPTIHSQEPSRSTTPTGFRSPSPHDPQTPRTPRTATRYARGGRSRRGSGTREERELSDKLRALGFDG